MRVDLQDRHPGILARGCRDQRRRDRVLAAERHQELAAADDLVGDALDFVDERLHLAEGQLHLGQREDPDAVHVGPHLLVPQLHVRRRLQDFVRAVSRAADIRGGAIDGDREDDDARVVERPADGQCAAEREGLDVIVVETAGPYYGPRSASAEKDGRRPDIVGPDKIEAQGLPARE